MRTSYSAIGTYLQCPQKYKFQEIDKIKAPKSREALFGSLIHQTLNFMFRSDPLFPTLDEVIGYFRDYWPSREMFLRESEHDPLRIPWSEDDEKAYFEEGIRMLKRFYEKNSPWNFSVLDLESRFEINIEDAQTGRTHTLAGIIDRVDRTADGKYEIIDYKTSKRMPSQDALENNLQLALYSLGLQKRWPHVRPEEMRLSLYFLKHGEKMSTAVTADTTEKTKNHILQTVSEIEERIRSGKEFEPVPGPLCNWCGFRPLCPAWRHLYKKTKEKELDENAIEGVVAEFLRAKKEKQEYEKKIKKLQEQIISFMERHNLTRLFGTEGYIAKKTLQKYGYSLEAIQAILQPLGRWEAVLKLDDTKLKNMFLELPPEIRKKLFAIRTLIKEYSVISTSFKKLKSPENVDILETPIETDEN